MGFEPTVPFDITGFQDRLLKPLGHLSVFALSILYSAKKKVKENFYRLLLDAAFIDSEKNFCIINRAYRKKFIKGG